MEFNIFFLHLLTRNTLKAWIETFLNKDSTQNPCGNRLDPYNKMKKILNLYKVCLKSLLSNQILEGEPRLPVNFESSSH